MTHPAELLRELKPLIDKVAVYGWRGVDSSMFRITSMQAKALCDVQDWFSAYAFRPTPAELSGPRLEYVSEDVPVVYHRVNERLEILLRMDDREPIGFCLYGYSTRPAVEEGERERVKDLLLKHVRGELCANALTGEPYARVAGLNDARDAILAALIPSPAGETREPFIGGYFTDRVKAGDRLDPDTGKIVNATPVVPVEATREDVNSDGPPKLWLQPSCCVQEHLGRLWSEDRHEECSCDAQMPDTMYIRADLAAAPPEGDVRKAREVLVAQAIEEASGSDNGCSDELHEAVMAYLYLTGDGELADDLARLRHEPGA